MYRFLIVDDDPACRRLLNAILSRHGECTEASGGLEAIGAHCMALDRGEPFDLICLDIMMPDTDGHQVLDAIRRMEHDRGILGSDGIKIVMTTALRESKHCIRAFREGCESYVTKPISRAELLEQVGQLLGGLADSDRPETATPSTDGRPRYLIVDDDRLCRSLMEDILSPYGQCDFAYDGSEAIEAVRLATEDKDPYELICLDIMMPGTSGLDALSAIRKAEREHGVAGSDGAKVIMTTALKDSQRCIQAFRQGCESYVTKPINADKLLAAMRELDLPLVKAVAS